jgi:hypothetical protein
MGHGQYVGQAPSATRRTTERRPTRSMLVDIRSSESVRNCLFTVAMVASVIAIVPDMIQAHLETKDEVRPPVTAGGFIIQ